MSLDQNQANMATLKAFYTAIFSNDWAAVERLVTADLVVHEADGLPYRGSYHGLEQLKALFARVAGYWDGLSIEVRAVTAGDGHAIGLLQFSGRSKSTAMEISMPIAEVTEFSDGRICSIRPVYWDTALIARAIAD